MPKLSKKRTYKPLDLIGFPGYLVSDTGRVWSLWKITPLLKGRGTYSFIGNTYKELSQNPDKDGYLMVTLKHEKGITKWPKVHRLVLEAFIGPCPPGMQCRHLNGNPADNNLINLCWGTPVENSQDKEVHGTGNKGEKHGLAKLTEPQVREIKTLNATKRYSQIALATMFGVSRGCICDIVRGINWSHVVI